MVPLHYHTMHTLLMIDIEPNVDERHVIHVREDCYSTGVGQYQTFVIYLCIYMRSNRARNNSSKMITRWAPLGANPS